MTNDNDNNNNVNNNENNDNHHTTQVRSVEPHHTSLPLDYLCPNS